MKRTHLATPILLAALSFSIGAVTAHAAPVKKSKTHHAKVNSKQQETSTDDTNKFVETTTPEALTISENSNKRIISTNADAQASQTAMPATSNNDATDEDSKPPFVGVRYFSFDGKTKQSVIIKENGEAMVTGSSDNTNTYFRIEGDTIIKTDKDGHPTGESAKLTETP